MAYDRSKIEFGRTNRTEWENIDVSLTKVSDKIIPLFAEPYDMMIFLEDDAGVRKLLPFSREEGRGMQSVAAAYQKLSNLAEDKSWWKAFTVNDPKAPKKRREGDPLATFRVKNQKPVIAFRAWINPVGQKVEASVAGFLSEKVVLRLGNGNVLDVPFTGFTVEDQRLFLRTRLEADFESVEHPLDSALKYYWPKVWGDDRLSRHAILLAVDEHSGHPRLVLQHYTRELRGETLARSILRGDHMEKETRLSLANQMESRDQGRVWSWLPLTGESLSEVLKFGDAREIYFQLHTESDAAHTGSFSPGGLRATQEAIAIYNWMKRLPSS